MFPGLDLYYADAAQQIHGHIIYKSSTSDFVRKDLYKHVSWYISIKHYKPNGAEKVGIDTRMAKSQQGL